MVKGSEAPYAICFVSYTLMESGKNTYFYGPTEKVLPIFDEYKKKIENTWIHTVILQWFQTKEDMLKALRKEKADHKNIDVTGD